MKKLFLLKKQILILVVKFSCIFNLPFIYSLVLMISFKKINNIKYNLKSKKKLLFFYKSIGINDIKSAFNSYPSNYPIFFCESIYLLEVFDHFVSNQVKDHHYKIKNTEDGKKDYRNFMRKTFQFIKKNWNLGGFISASIFYRQLKEIENFSEELNLPFIVVHKEGIRSRKEREVEDWIIKNRVGKFGGSKLIVYNNDEKNSYLNINYTSKEKIDVCGCPRFDNFHKMRGQPQEKTIVFFMIQKDYGLPMKNNKWFVPKELQNKIKVKSFDWNFINKKYTQLIREFIIENPEYNIIIKAKTGHIEEQLKDLKKIKNKNVKFVMGGDSYEIIKKSKYVVVFNSAVLFETIAAKRILISVRDLIKKKNYDGFILETKKLHYTSKVLKNLKKINYPKKNKAQKNFILNKYMGNVSGNSSVKVAKSINNHLNKYHKN